MKPAVFSLHACGTLDHSAKCVQGNCSGESAKHKEDSRHHNEQLLELEIDAYTQDFEIARAELIRREANLEWWQKRVETIQQELCNKYAIAKKAMMSDFVCKNQLQRPRLDSIEVVDETSSARETAENETELEEDCSDVKRLMVHTFKAFMEVRAELFDELGALKQLWKLHQNGLADMENHFTSVQCPASKSSVFDIGPLGSSFSSAPDVVPSDILHSSGSTVVTHADCIPGELAYSGEPKYKVESIGHDVQAGKENTRDQNIRREDSGESLLSSYQPALPLVQSLVSVYVPRSQSVAEFLPEEIKGGALQTLSSSWVVGGRRSVSSIIPPRGQRSRCSVRSSAISVSKPSIVLRSELCSPRKLVSSTRPRKGPESSFGSFSSWPSSCQKLNRSSGAVATNKKTPPKSNQNPSLALTSPRLVLSSLGPMIVGAMSGGF